jgi:hypothetical protein
MSKRLVMFVFSHTGWFGETAAPMQVAAQRLERRQAV